MATPTLSAPRRPGRAIIRGLTLVLILLLLSAIAASWWFYRAARASLPQLDGSMRVAVSAPVTVVRDAHGVPHITAANMQDLLFAQGYVTAQDRLWQMDMTRRYI